MQIRKECNGIKNVIKMNNVKNNVTSIVSFLLFVHLLGEIKL